MKRFLALMGATILILGCVSLLRPPFSLPLFSSTASRQPTAVELAQSSFKNQLNENKLNEKQRGVSWVGDRQVVSLDDFATLTENHVNWMVQTPFGWQRDYNTPQLSLATQNVYWGESDEGLAVTTDLAQSLGIQTLLKPHLWLTQPSDGKWRTEIEMQSEQDWQAWFGNYRRFILHYATFAEAHSIPILCIGTELQTTAVLREQDWRQLIAEIRRVYSGQLTYAANWYQAFESIQFWDALDFIGIQAYFPLAQATQPSLETLKAGWRSHLSSIEKVQQRYQKPVIFTELGYRSTDDAAIAPWEWPTDSEVNPKQLATAAGLNTQAKCYEAFFQTVWQQDWFAGTYIWKWFPKLDGTSQRLGRGFTPQHKPAEAVLQQWYGQA